MADMQKILERIQKMLALAENNNSPEEAATAAAMAEKLMRKHQIESADLLEADLTSGAEKVTESVLNSGTGKRTPLWHGYIINGAAKANGCEVVKTLRNGGSFYRFYGVGGDGEVARHMSEYLIGEIERLATRYSGHKQSFRVGAATTIYQRLMEIAEEREREFSQSQAGTSLVIVKDQLIRAAMPKTQKSRERARVTDGASYHAGERAGAQVGFDPQVTKGRAAGRIR